MGLLRQLTDDILYVIPAVRSVVQALLSHRDAQDAGKHGLVQWPGQEPHVFDVVVALPFPG